MSNDKSLLALSKEEFNQLVSDAYTSYRDGEVLVLAASPLADSELTAACFFSDESVTPAKRGRVMRCVLRWGVDTLRAGGEHSWMASDWRYYNILNGLYLLQMSVAKVAEKMGIANSTVHLWRKDALKFVSQRLRGELINPQALTQRRNYALDDRYGSCSSDERLLLRVTAIFRLPVPLKYIYNLCEKKIKRESATIQESIHNLVMARLLLPNEQKTEFWAHLEIHDYLLTRLSPKERWDWHFAAAKHYAQEHNYIEAAHHFRQAGAFQDAAQILIEHHQEIIDSHQVSTLRELLEQFQSRELRNQPDSWETLRLVAGQAAEFMGDLEDAQEKYRQALGAKDVHIKAQAYKQRAKVFVRTKNIDEALAHYNVGIELLEEGTEGELLLAQMYIYRAWIFIEERQDLEQAATSLIRAEALIDRNYLAEWADLHNAWGRLWRDRKEPKRASEHRFKAWMAANELQYVKLMINIGHNLGIDYALQHQYERALQYLKESKALAIRTGNREMEASCNEQIGTCHFYLAQYEEAFSHYQDAYNHYVKSGNRKLQGSTCYNLSEFYFKSGDRTQAHQYFKEGVAIAKELGAQRLLAGFEALREQMSLNERQKQGLEHVKREGEIRKRKYRELTGATDKQARTDLSDLVEQKILQLIGKGRGSRYVLDKKE